MTHRKAPWNLTAPSRIPIACLAILTLAACWAGAQPLALPTANEALFLPGAEDQFFAPTPSRTWESGTFGCVRTDGWQLHEGIDIRCLERNRRGEPTDPILATAAGTVVYLNRVAGNSNYGQYLILRHTLQGLELYSTYAHLKTMRADLHPGQSVQAGEQLAVMGRTANTREPIAQERAHLHFEINLLLSDRYEAWHRQRYPKNRNDHGNWNGRGLIGIDPAALFRAQHEQGGTFRLVPFLRQQTELCRVWIAETNFFWLRTYPQFIRPNPRAAQEGVAGFEVALNYLGFPFELIPRAASEFASPAPFQLLSVNATERDSRPCGKILSWEGRRWELTGKARDLLELMAFH